MGSGFTVPKHVGRDTTMIPKMVNAPLTPAHTSGLRRSIQEGPYRVPIANHRVGDRSSRQVLGGFLKLGTCHFGLRLIKILWV